MSVNRIFTPCAPRAAGTNRFPLDAFLRKHGFTIYSRVTGQPPLWIHEGEIFVQGDAELMAQILEEECEGV